MAEAPLRTLIVDDEPLAVERLQILAAAIPDVQLVGSAADAAQALRLVDALNPDLLLLDIAMPGMTGLALAEELARRPNRPAVVFVTAYDHHAVAAFDIAAADYLLKPASGERLARAIERVRALRQAPALPPDQYAREFWVPHRAEVIRIDAAAIDLVEAERDYMRLHVGERSYLIHTTIGELERRLDPAEFIRLHRSTIVRRDTIARLLHDGLGGWRARLADGRELRVGRTYQAAVRALAGR